MKIATVEINKCLMFPEEYLGLLQHPGALCDNSKRLPGFKYDHKELHHL